MRRVREVTESIPSWLRNAVMARYQVVIDRGDAGVHPLPDAVTLEVTFDYTGMEAGQAWLYRSYVDGFRNDNFSIPPESFDFDVPEGGIVLTFTDQNRFRTGEVIRVEIFIEGNLLAAGEFTTP